MAFWHAKSETTTETLPDLRAVTGLNAPAKALPDLRAATLPMRPVTKSEAVELVSRKPVGGPPPKYVAEANERWRFLRSVHDHIGTECETITEACGHIVLLHRGEYSILGPKKIATPEKAMRNYGTWMPLLGTHANGRINWDNQEALIPRYARGVRKRAGHEKCWEFLAAAYEEDNQRKLPLCHQMMAVAMRRAGVPENEIPTLRQARRWYRTHVTKAELLFSRKGEVFAVNHLIGHIRRDWSNVKPNDCWFADHHQADLFVRVPDGKGGWTATRFWLTVWMDARTWAVLGWAIRADSPNATIIMRTLLDAILRNGMHCAPILYTDNGADFCTTGLGSPFVSPTGAELTCLPDLGVTRVIHSKPYNGRAKPVERLFGIFAEWFSKIWPSYCGNKSDARPDKAHYFYGNPEQLPTVGQVVALFEQWLPMYHSLPNKGETLQGKAPVEAWTHGTGGPELSAERLQLGLCLPVATRMVGPGGSVRINNLWFSSRSLWSLVGERIVVRADPVYGFAWACKLGGEPIAELTIDLRVPAIAQTPDERALLAEKLREQGINKQALYAARERATGGLVGLSLLDLMQMDFSRPYQIEEVGRVKSVKGPGHTFIHKAVRQGDTYTGFAMPEVDGAGAVQGGCERVAETPQVSGEVHADLERFLAEQAGVDDFPATVSTGVVAAADVDRWLDEQGDDGNE